MAKYNLGILSVTLELNNKLFAAGLKAAAVGIGAVVAGMAIATKATFDWANDIDSLGDVMDGTNKEFAALAFLARKSGVGVDALAKAGSFLNKGLLKIDGSLDITGKKLKEFGINVKDANGVQKDSVALLDEVGRKYSELGTQQERVNLLTEIFGKSGAELVDLFDTMASEGGIDKVSEKVERLGLAIDPNRYEQFNRNLEELKLIGLGLAVSFTEKAMPALEGFLGLITDFAADPDFGKLMSKLDNFVAKMFKGMGDSINNWVSSGGAEELSNAAIAWIDNIGTGGGTQSKIEIAVKHLGEAIINAFKNIDWAGIDAALDRLDAKILQKFDEMDASILATFDKWDADIVASLNQLDTNMNAAVATGLKKIDLAFVNWSISTWNTIKTWASNLWSAATEAMTGLDLRLETKLREIGKKFFTRAAGWVQQAIQGFTGQTGSLIATVSNLVASINAELRRIITSFRISISTVFGGSSSQTTGSTNSGSSSGGSVGTHTPPVSKRATGGATIANRAYDVVELNKPEVFAPFTAGRIDPVKSDNEVTLSRKSIDELSERLGRILKTSVVSAMNNA